MELRPYQRQAVEAVYEFLRTRDDNPCVVIPTAGGKTPVMATICRDAVQLWNGRVLILAHVRELLEQAAEKLRLVAPDLPVGIYSAGLKRRDLGYAVTIAGIQSVYQKACDLGPMDLVIVDECHLIPEDNEGMYRQFLADMKVIHPQVRIIGLTATPFRMKSGTICAPDNILNAVCFEIGVRELIVQGYLCPLRTKAGTLKPDTQKLHVRGGEFIAGEVEDLMDDDGLVLSACREIIEYTQERRSVLIFASGVRHGQHICHVLEERHQVECGFVCGETLPFERDSLLKRFRDGALKYLCNINVLTTGFDAPNIDCVALVRPTLSPGLFYQMCGRGFRLNPGKSDCLAEGQRVLTDQGLIPIERVTTDMRVWDGEGFVAHEGAVCRGIQEVIEYAGLIATPDHRVWTEAGWRTFGECASEQVPISTTGDEGQAIREAAGRFRIDNSSWHARTFLPTDPLYDMRCGIAQSLRQSDSANRRVQAMRTATEGTEMAGATSLQREGPLHQSSQQEVLRLRRAWHPVSLRDTHRDGCLDSTESRPSSRAATGPDRQQRKLRTRQSAVCDSIRKSEKHAPTRTKRRVWDILNAGPRHRFTCEGLLVSNCLILDYGGNVLRHGPIDQLRVTEPSTGNGEAPAKECPQCHALIAAGYANCPECGHEFPERNWRKHDATASSEGILSDQVTRTEHEVTEVFYSVHTKRGAPPDAPRTMRVDYQVALNQYVSEWVCFEHTGFPRQKAEQWWSRRSSEPVPATAEEAVEMAEAGALTPTLAITVEHKAGDPFDRVVSYRLGGKPPRLESEEGLPEYAPTSDDDEVPF